MFGNFSSVSSSVSAIKPASVTPPALSKDENELLVNLAKHEPEQAKAHFAAHPEKAAPFAAANPEIAAKLGIAVPAKSESSSTQDTTAISPAAVNGQPSKALDSKFADAAAGLSDQDYLAIVKDWQKAQADTTAPSAREKDEAKSSSDVEAAKPAQAQPANPAQAGGGEQVTVAKGDTLSKIAARLGVSLADLKAANPDLFKEGVDGHGHRRKANGDMIYPGDVVKNPKAAAKPQEQGAVQAGGGTGTAQGVEAKQREQVELYRKAIEKQVSAKLGHEVKIHIDPKGSPSEQVALVARVLGAVDQEGAKQVSEINLKVSDAKKTQDAYEVNVKDKALELVFHRGDAARSADKAPVGSAATTTAAPTRQAADAQNLLIQNLKKELARLQEQDKILAADITTPLNEAAVASTRRQMQGISPESDEQASKSTIAMARRQLLAQQMAALSFELKIAEGFKIPAEATPKDAAALAGIFGHMNHLISEMRDASKVADTQAKLSALADLSHNPGLYDAKAEFFSQDPVILNQAITVKNLQNRVGRLLSAMDDLLPDLADPKKKAVAQARINTLETEIKKVIKVNDEIKTYTRPNDLTPEQAAKQVETLRNINALTPQLIDPDTGDAAAAQIAKDIAALKAAPAR